MKNIYKLTGLIALLAFVFTACEIDNDAVPAEDFAGLGGSSENITGARGTTVTVTVVTYASDGGASLTANGTAVTIGADQEGSFDVAIPATDTVGTTYTVDWVLTSGSATDELTSIVEAIE